MVEKEGETEKNWSFFSGGDRGDELCDLIGEEMASHPESEGFRDEDHFFLQ